jgi:hypothetical protein
MRFKFLGSLLVVILAMLGLTATAFANEKQVSAASEPQTTNIPYTAWVGSEIRLAKCFDIREDDSMITADMRSRLDSGQRVSLDSLIYRGKFTIEAWSGTNTSIVNSPFFVNGSNGDRTSQDVVPFLEHYRGAGVLKVGTGDTRFYPGDEGTRLCFAVHLTSYSPGLAVVKLAVREDLLGLFPGQDPQLKHQFLAIFMTATAATLTEEAGGGDPTGSGAYHPQGTAPNRKWNPGYVKAVVKGTFPHGNIGPVFPVGPANITLPDDWAVLANLWAVDNDPSAGGVYGSAPMRWDIHDDTANTEDHNSSFCLTSAVLIDAVDNCNGLFSPPYWNGNDADLGPFSRADVDHDVLGSEAAFPAIGPFDPLRPNSSLLPDGKVDAGDANMPALRVDLDTTGTIGQLIKADKSNVYSRDGTGSTTGALAHNLYAPFYKAYVPAANRSGTSGVAGTYGNNFPGFVTDDRTYDYWDTLLPESYDNADNTCRNPLGQVYQGSSGVSGVTLYTDEHGEAWAMFDPNVNPSWGGFDLPETVADVNNRKCDVSPGVAGVETITASGRYPEQPATGIAFDKPLTKTVFHEGSKTLTCAEKVGFGGIICTETITDLAGNPLPGAKARFAVVSEAGGGAQVLQGEGQIGYLGQKGLTLTSDVNGQAKAYISDSFNRCLDIRVENLGTQWLPWRANGPGDDSSVGVTRTVKYTGLTGVVCGTVAPPVVTPPVVVTPGGSSGGSSSGGSSSAAGSAVTVSLGGPVIQAQPVLQVSTASTVIASNSAKLFSVKVLQTNLGRFLVVNVKGSAKTAKIRIAIMGKNGKVLRTIVRTVPTNKAFKIVNFKLAKTAISVKASVIA